MPINRTVRYAAKEAYKLALMTGRYASTIAGHRCVVRPQEGIVAVKPSSDPFAAVDIIEVPIADSWKYL